MGSSLWDAASNAPSISKTLKSITSLHAMTFSQVCSLRPTSVHRKSQFSRSKAMNKQLITPLSLVCAASSALKGCAKSRGTRVVEPQQPSRILVGEYSDARM